MSASKKWVATVGLLVIVALVVWKVRRISERVSRSAAAVPSAPVVAPPAAAPAVPPVVPPAPAKVPKPKMKPPPVPVRVRKPIAAPKITSTHIAAPPAASVAPMSIPVAPRPVVPYRPLRPPPPPAEWKGNEDTAIRHSGQIVVTKEGQWIRFWAEHHPDEAAPDVDFTQNMVVGVFVGERPAHLFSVQIVNLRSTPKALIVEYAEHPPPPGTFEMGVSVYPYDIKAIPRTTLPVEFKKVNP